MLDVGVEHGEVQLCRLRGLDGWGGGVGLVVDLTVRGRPGEEFRGGRKCLRAREVHSNRAGLVCWFRCRQPDDLGLRRPNMAKSLPPLMTVVAMMSNKRQAIRRKPGRPLRSTWTVRHRCWGKQLVVTILPWLKIRHNNYCHRLPSYLSLYNVEGNWRVVFIWYEF